MKTTAKSVRGQALAEAALVLPLMMLVVIALFHLLLVIRVKMELQATAERMADAVAVGKPYTPVVAAEALQLRRYSRWGKLVPGRFGARAAVYTPYRRWWGAGANKDPGRIAVAELEYRLWSPASTGWARWAGTPIRARAELPLEPARPGEGS